MTEDLIIIVTARNEADTIDSTLRALTGAFPGASIWVADDGSSDGTAEIVNASSAELVRSPRPAGKGGAATLAARAALSRSTVNDSTVVLLCDGDLGDSAIHLDGLTKPVADGQADLAVGAFARRVGGGVGLAVGFARWAIRRRCGLLCEAPISGQRALAARVLERVLPFERGFGMEIGMTIDAVRAGYDLVEVELDLTHRATGRTLSGFVHRGRQLADFARVYWRRR
jgi:glycosyltransferase involved in cell wall biosynthesis